VRKRFNGAWAERRPSEARSSACRNAAGNRAQARWLGGPIAAIIDTADDYALVALPGAIADSPLAGALSASGDRHCALIATTVKT